MQNHRAANIEAPNVVSKVREHHQPGLREIREVQVEGDAVVGTGLSDGGKAMACALTAIGDIQVHMLSLSASGINLTVVVDGEQVAPAMQRLHAAFFGDSATCI